MNMNLLDSKVKEEIGCCRANCDVMLNMEIEGRVCELQLHLAGQSSSI